MGGERFVRRTAPQRSRHPEMKDESGATVRGREQSLTVPPGSPEPLSLAFAAQPPLGEAPQHPGVTHLDVRDTRSATRDQHPRESLNIGSSGIIPKEVRGGGADESDRHVAFHHAQGGSLRQGPVDMASSTTVTPMCRIWASSAE
ncbi:hypothetical protein GCM10012285_24540 [Streptomyces kronopolitis]|uniref:Uncharacterized protein n=1 Tax=Streptomyces kronopolitis TaxID=1612435 RepID=A0ABQ2JDU1_9ACTN|nr:hypothetical protein GCM10012285_24540 [Streptomyces kronopolitis]